MSRLQEKDQGSRVGRRSILKAGISIGLATAAGAGVYEAVKALTKKNPASSEMTTGPQVVVDIAPYEFQPVLRPTEFIYSYDIAIPESTLQTVIPTVESLSVLARDYYFRQLGTYVKGQVRYDIKSDPRPGLHALTDGNSIAIGLGQYGWTQENLIKAVPHEQFHSMQNFLHHKSGASIGLHYLHEGAADYASLMSAVDRGDMTYNDMIAQLMARARKAPLPKLNSLQNSTNTDASYAMGALGVDFMVKGKGLAPLGEFYKTLSHNGWQPAFEMTFGETPQTAEARFEDWRKANSL